MVAIVIVVVLLMWLVEFYLEKYVIKSLLKTNETLRAITKGNLEETLDIANCAEFSELSDHINGMARSLREYTDRIKTERDHDAMTGILNRRGFDRSIVRIFDNASLVGHSAVLMIDGDGLKGINDSFGHDGGDAYIKGIVELLDAFGKKYCGAYLLCRNGGDEFVMFIYGFDSRQALMEAIRELRGLQDKQHIALEGKEEVLLRFSFGYCIRDEKDSYYGELFRQADEMMYEDKKKRKQLEA